MTYGLRLWHFKGARVKGVIKTLAQVQSIAACWILGAFRTTPIGGLESIAGLLPLQLLLRRLVDRGVFRTPLLAPSHPLRAILGPNHVGTTHSHELGLWGGNVRDTLNLQGPSVASAAALALVPGDEFDPFGEENTPGNRVKDLFPTRFSSHRLTSKEDGARNSYRSDLDKAWA
ncbi:hypothetical protein L208DRAFT_1518332, partial [Tricholoma matsutake]